MAKQRGTKGGQGNTVTLRHPKYGSRTLTQSQFRVLQAAAETRSLKTTEIADKTDYEPGTVYNLFTQIYKELSVDGRVEAVTWFKEAEVVSEDTELVDAELEKPVPIAEDQDNLANVRGWQQRFTYTLSAGSVFGGFIIFGYIFFFHARGTTMNDWSNVYSFVPLIGGSMGIWIVLLARKFTKAYYYLPIEIICFGIIYWSIGGLIWLYLNIKGIEQPYPSVPDVGYAPAAIAIILGCFCNRSRAAVGSRKSC